MSYSLIFHDCLNVSEVKVNLSRYFNKVSYTLNALL